MPRWRKSILDQIYRQAEGRCVVCQKSHTRNSYPRAWNVDHIIPQSLGGEDDIANLRMTCVKCNSKKMNQVKPSDYIETAVVRALQRHERTQETNSPTSDQPVQRCRECGIPSNIGMAQKPNVECKIIGCENLKSKEFFDIIQWDHCEEHRNDAKICQSCWRHYTEPLRQKYRG